MVDESVKLHGALTLTLRKHDGQVEVIHKDNIIVNVGFDFIADAIGNATQRPDVMGWIAVGTGSDPALATQATLVAEIDRNAASYSHTSGTKVFTFTADFPAGDATGPLTEAGVFNAAVDGVMLDRVAFPVVNKGVDDSLTTVFTFTMS